jgi:hypothetical protein
MAQLPHQRDRLQSAEAFFDSLPLSLVHGVARVPRVAVVNRAAARARIILRYMRRHPQISALFHEVPCIKLLVATYGHKRINEQVTAGLRYNGPISHRAQDSVAFGMVYSKSSDHFNQSCVLQSLPVLGAEKAFEVNYLFQATHRLVLQPAVQYLAEGCILIAKLTKEDQLA